jgi:DNA-binding CsgD family transcriptional regulator
MSLLNYRYCNFGIHFLLVILFTTASEASNIKGKLIIGDSWEPVIYLSAINSFDDFNTVSYDFLVYQSNIDSLGNFEMNDLVLPEDNRIYRLHICKINDPVSTIIIGGRDENFIHFVMNNQSHINIYPNKEMPFFQNSIVDGNVANGTFRLLMQFQKELLTPPKLPSKQNREFLRNQIINKFGVVADTSSHDIIKLLAVDLINESGETSALTLMEKMAIELQVSDTSNPYYQSFVKQLEYLRYQNGNIPQSNLKWITVAGFLILLLGIGYFTYISLRHKTKSSYKPNAKLLQTLSVQEKKVFDLIRSGASNKEISADLNIEVSTVKSHVYKIFSRLGVKSRKEIVNGNW